MTRLERIEYALAVVQGRSPVPQSETPQANQKDWYQTSKSAKPNSEMYERDWSGANWSGARWAAPFVLGRGR